MDMSLSKLWETMKDMEAWPAAICGVSKSQAQLSNWTTKLRSDIWTCNLDLLPLSGNDISVSLKYLELGSQM